MTASHPASIVDQRSRDRRLKRTISRRVQDTGVPAVKLTRSETMARVRSNDTTPELMMRRGLHAAGLRFRLHRADLPGCPDIVFPSRKAALFVHGCFWHSHTGCPRARVPATRHEYWIPKLRRNVERDHAAMEALRAAGWFVVVVWECQTRLPATMAAVVERIKLAPITSRPQLNLGDY